MRGCGVDRSTREAQVKVYNVVSTCDGEHSKSFPACAPIYISGLGHILNVPLQLQTT